MPIKNPIQQSFLWLVTPEEPESCTQKPKRQHWTAGGVQRKDLVLKLKKKNLFSCCIFSKNWGCVNTLGCIDMRKKQSCPGAWSGLHLRHNRKTFFGYWTPFRWSCFCRFALVVMVRPQITHQIEGKRNRPTVSCSAVSFWNVRVCSEWNWPIAVPCHDSPSCQEVQESGFEERIAFHHPCNHVHKLSGTKSTMSPLFSQTFSMFFMWSIFVLDHNNLRQVVLLILHSGRSILLLSSCTLVELDFWLCLRSVLQKLLTIHRGFLAWQFSCTSVGSTKCLSSNRGLLLWIHLPLFCPIDPFLSSPGISKILWIFLSTATVFHNPKMLIKCTCSFASLKRCCGKEGPTSVLALDAGLPHHILLWSCRADSRWTAFPTPKPGHTQWFRPGASCCAEPCPEWDISSGW